MSKDLVYQVTVPASEVNKMLKSVLDKCEIDFVGFEETVAVYPDAGERQPKRLIKIRCPECGRINVKLCEGDMTLTCRYCNKTYKFDLDQLERVQYTCQECGLEQYFYMPDVEGMALASNLCKNCRHETALCWSEEQKMFVEF